MSKRPDRHNKQSGRSAQFLFITVALLAATLIFVFRQDLRDWLVLRSYQPPAGIAKLATDTAMSEKGRHYFYVAQPELHGKADFSTYCKSVGSEDGNVLGCYAGQRIYLYDVQDTQLAGVREVTAAHEMLHVVYERLSNAERSAVDAMIQRQLKAGVAPHIQELIRLYERLEPGQLLNELHSILATEQSTVIPELEHYYTQYFNDRRTVVQLSDSYRAVFDGYKRRQQALVTEIDALANAINKDTTTLNAAVQRYNKDVSAFNEAAAAGTMTRDAFTTDRSELVARRDNLDGMRRSIEDQRALYDNRRQTLESLAIEFNGLQEKINSQPEPLTDMP